MDTTKTPPVRLSQLMLLAALLFAATIPGQQAVTPIKPTVVVETVGPDGWRTRLGPTNVGVMLSSITGQSIWRPLVEPMFAWWDTVMGGSGAAVAASERIMDYGGVIRIALLPGKNGTQSIAVVFESDGRSDLKAIARDLKQVLDRGGSPGRWQDETLADKTVRVFRRDYDMISEPMLEGDRIVIVYVDHDNLAEAMGLAAHLTNRPTTGNQPRPDSPALQISINLAELYSPLGDEDMDKVFGFDDLEQLDIALRSAGPKVELDFTFSLKGPARGIVAGFLPDSQGVSSLRQLIPEHTSMWKVGRFDCHAIYNGIAEAVLKVLGGEDIRKQINKEVGFDFGEELLANITDELLVVGSPLDGFDHLTQATWLIAFRVKPKQDISANLQKSIDSLKPFASTAETVDVNGIGLRRHGNMTGYDLWTAAGNGLVLLAGGRDAEACARAMLLKAGTLDLHAPQTEAAKVRGLTRYLPPGLNGLAQADIYSCLGLTADWWLDGLEPMGLPFDFSVRTIASKVSEEQLAQLRRLLEDHNLVSVQSATGFADKRWHWRLYW